VIAGDSLSTKDVRDCNDFWALYGKVVVASIEVDIERLIDVLNGVDVIPLLP